jgi:hypothetical protein
MTCVNAAHKRKKLTGLLKQLMPQERARQRGVRFPLAATAKSIEHHRDKTCAKHPRVFAPIDVEDGVSLEEIENRMSAVGMNERREAFSTRPWDKATFWEGKTVETIHRDVAAAFRRQSEKLSQDALEADSASLRVHVAKAALMHESLAWRVVGDEAKRKGLTARKVLVRRRKLWDEGAFETLIAGLQEHNTGNEEEIVRARPAKRPLDVRQDARADNVKQAEHAKAMQAIEDTEKWQGKPEVLRGLFPKNPEILEAVDMDVPLPDTSKWDFDKATREQKRGMRAAPRGKKMDHVTQCNLKPSGDEDGELRLRDPWCYTRQLAVQIASGFYDWGEFSDTMHQCICPVAMSVLKKDNGKPRPIGAGSHPLRKLGNAVLDWPSADHTKNAMIEVGNTCHGGRGANGALPHFFQMMLEMAEIEADDGDFNPKDEAGPEDVELRRNRGIACSDGRNAFGEMLRRAVQKGLDVFLPPELCWMKVVFWRFHKNATKAFYRDPKGVMRIIEILTGFVQGENFSSFWHAMGQGPAFKLFNEEFRSYGARGAPFADDVPFNFDADRKVSLDEHPHLKELTVFAEKDEVYLGVAVMHRWSQLAKQVMGVTIGLSGQNKQVVLLPEVTTELQKAHGDIRITSIGVNIMGAPVGSDERRAAAILVYVKTAFKKFYDLSRDTPSKQIRLRLHHMCGATKKLNHLLRTQPRRIWNVVREDGLSTMNVVDQIMTEEFQDLLEAGPKDFNKRVSDQLEMNLECGGTVF